MTNLTSGPRTTRLLRSPVVGLFAGIATLALITGCGGSKAEDDSGQKSDVASLDGPGKAGTADRKTTAPGSEGVQLRLDSTEEEQRLINNAYSACLKKNGVPTYSKSGGALDPGSEWVFPETKSPSMRGAAEACKAKKPIQPPELDKEKNPHYMDDFREQLQCMDKRGVKTNALPDGSGYNYVGNLPPNYNRIEKECEVEAFGGKK
ncbi:hypothetical protein ABTZ93_42525 [Streptomyces sp. NPDC097941]|jgi:hypothetical protein|uniref:hypothetical protein n=1 Tax=Streptomyces sp. NPDC097941 TaxID=3155685 RepID=UPI00331F650A